LARLSQIKQISFDLEGDGQQDTQVTVVSLCRRSYLWDSKELEAYETQKADVKAQESSS